MNPQFPLPGGGFGDLQIVGPVGGVKRDPPVVRLAVITDRDPGEPPVQGEIHQGADDQTQAVGVEAEKDPHENHPASDLLVEVLL